MIRPPFQRLALAAAALVFCAAVGAMMTIANGAPVASTRPADWWNKDWPYRVTLNCPEGEGDVAVARVTLAGRTTPDGRDLRLVDAAGQLVPFEVLFHDPLLTTLLRCKVTDGKAQTLSLYFGNKTAFIINPLRPKDTVPAWEPQRGLVLKVYRKAKPGHPKTLDDLKDLVRKSTPEGAVLRDNVSDGFNPVGSSANYISFYEGWLNIDKAGTYLFCSASAEGSFIVVHGRTILSWPGPHGWGGAERGQKNGVLDLPKGSVRVQYYQEAGAGEHMAFLGWQPPDGKHFTGIPPKTWAAARQAAAGHYEARDKPLLAVPVVEPVNTYWVRSTAGLQTTLLAFKDRSASRAGRVTQATWAFGDGLEDKGGDVQHLYFRLGRPEAKLTVTDEKGNSDTVAFAANIFLVDVEGQSSFGNAKDHAALAEAYDPAKLGRDDLEGFTSFWLKLEHWKPGVAAAEEYLKRFADGPAMPAVAEAAADAYTQPAVYDAKQADRWYALAAEKAADPDARLSLTLRRGENLAWGLGDFKQARALYQQVQDATKKSEEAGLKDLYRRSIIAYGDAAMLEGDLPKAKDLYKQAEDLPWRRKAEQPAELAKVGGYPYTVEDLLIRGEYDYALKMIDQWEDGFPLQKLEGVSFFLRGKVLFVQHPGEVAQRYLLLAEKVAPHAPHVPEAVWLRANCLFALNRFDQALEQFKRIRADFTDSEYFQKSEEKIRECQKHLPAKPAK